MLIRRWPEAATTMGTPIPDPDSRDSSATPCEPVVVLGGSWHTPRDYWEMQPALEKLTGQAVTVVPTTRFDWALSVLSPGWARILDKLDRAVKQTLRRTGAAKVVLIGHSTGGVAARLYLRPEPFRGRTYAGLDSVRTLITLGSPNHTRRGSRMARRVETIHPGAPFSPAVRYVSVAGKAVHGDPYGKRQVRRSYRSYKRLCGHGEEWGDGVVPLPSALLAGSASVLLEGVYHFSRGGRPWYGNTRVVRLWWEAARQCLCEPRGEGV